MILPSGIPSRKKYEELLQSALFHRIEKFSNNFILENNDVLIPFNRKWTQDPLHQWSRQWEYPFVFSKLQHMKRSTRVLDAGSGITFFPYLLSSSFKGTEIFCADKDELLIKIYRKISGPNHKGVKFSRTNLEQLSFPDKYFDAIYCISVLEHSKQVTNIINQFHRVLKRDGLLLLTFDISLDGESEIPIKEVSELLAHIKRRFKVEKIQENVLFSEKRISKSITTHYIAQFMPKLLPWRFPLLTKIRSVLKFHFSRSLYHNLTVCCVIARK